MAARKARTSLLGFTSHTNPQYRVAGHHKLIAEKLEAVERGEIDRLMIFMPPRHGKSELASVRFPAWYLGRNPSHQIICASYAHKLAAKFGRQVRNLIASPEYQAAFPGISLSDDSQAKDLFNTNHGGVYMATGVDGSVTGSGGDLVSIDDPVKGRQEADSETVQETAWDWYRGDLYTRLMPGARIVLTQTRWNDADLAGRILDSEGRIEDGGQWHVLDLPAISEGGEALWPEWYPLPALERIRDAIGPREWSALYQQRPQPDEGTFFKREYFRRYDVRPQRLHYYMTSDHAPGEGDGTDWNVFRVWGIDCHQHVYMVDGYRTQGTLDKALGIETNAASGELALLPEGGLPLIKKWKPLCWFPEDDNNWKASKAFVIAAMRRLKVPCRIEALSPHGQDKPTKARPIQAKASMGEVWFPSGPVGDAIIDECIRFPAGRNDDEVDTLSLIGRAIDQAHPALTVPEDSKKPRDMWATPDRTEGDWRTA